ncbi:MAG: hypothetical protein ACM3WV_05990 [Bacillota bacterium]
MRKPIFIAIIFLLTSGWFLFSSGILARKQSYVLNQQRINALKEHGYTEEDVYAAYSLTFDTDVSIFILLSHKRNFGTWENVISYLKQKNQFHEPQVVKMGTLLPPLTAAQRKIFYKKRFYFTDMDQAHDLMNLYQINEKELINLKQGYTTWENVGIILKRDYKKRPDRYYEIKVPPGMTPSQVQEYLSRGYSPEQIMETDKIVRRTGRKAQEILQGMAPEEKK